MAAAPTISPWRRVKEISVRSIRPDGSGAVMRSNSRTGGVVESAEADVRGGSAEATRRSSDSDDPSLKEEFVLRSASGVASLPPNIKATNPASDVESLRGKVPTTRPRAAQTLP